MTRTPRRFVAGLIAVIAGVAAHAADTASVAAQQAVDAAGCERLSSVKRPGVTINAADVVAAGQFQLADDDDQEQRGTREEMRRLIPQLPAFCRVQATLSPTSDSEIGIETWMPLTGWNGKFQGVGNGAFLGSIPYPALVNALARGYATAATDTGHRGNNARFAPGHPEKVIDFGSRAVHVMTEESKALMAGLYRRQPQWSYWNGCSAGGREGIKEAQMFPSDYDGIIAGAPGVDWSGRATQAAKILKQTLAEEARLTAEDRQLVHEAALKACDAGDGLRDGLVSDPLRCTVPIATLACRSDGPARCLSPKKIETAELLYAPIIFPTRTTGGLLPGSELGWTDRGWSASARATAEELFRHLVYRDPSWDASRYDGASDLARATDADAGVIDARAGDLRPFFTRGGKLLQYHGLSDPQISPVNSIEFYQLTRGAVSAAAADAAYRLFLAPGMGHCRGGEGPNTFDALAALEQWVERGEAPQRLEASHRTEGKVDRTRPLCAFPSTAVYSGSGSIDDAANFRCAGPSAPR